MNIVKTALDGVLIIEPKVFGDARGFFTESWNEQRFNEAVGSPGRFVQDNHSRSRKGVLRGLHFQRAPHAQGKLVRCVAGAVFDVAVDLRAGSPTFGQWAGVELTADNHRQFWVPPGFAHGFLTLSDSADFLYKTTDFYAPACEGAVLWNDADIGIAWPDLGETPQLAAKDAAAARLRDTESL